MSEQRRNVPREVHAPPQTVDEQTVVQALDEYVDVYRITCEGVNAAVSPRFTVGHVLTKVEADFASRMAMASALQRASTLIKDDEHKNLSPEAKASWLTTYVSTGYSLARQRGESVDVLDMAIARYVQRALENAGEAWSKVKGNQEIVTTLAKLRGASATPERIAAIRKECETIMGETVSRKTRTKKTEGEKNKLAGALGNL